jgi:cytochrome c-type biogenesis protein CcmH/NrfF
MTKCCRHGQISSMKLTRRSVFFASAILSTVGKALANAANGDPRLERLFSNFMAPCCWRENLLVLSSPLADELRTEIRKRVAEGKSDEEIKSHFLSRYTSRILAMPEGAKATWLSWTPGVLIAAGTCAVAAFISRSRKQPAATPAGENLPELPESEWNT